MNNLDRQLNRTHSSEYWSWTRFANEQQLNCQLWDSVNFFVSNHLFPFMDNLEKRPAMIISTLPKILVYHEGAAFNPYVKLFCVQTIEEALRRKLPGLEEQNRFISDLIGPLIDKVLACYLSEENLGGQAADAESIVLEPNSVEQWIKAQGQRLVDPHLSPPQLNIAQQIIQALPWIIRRVETVRGWNQDAQKKAIAALVEIQVQKNFQVEAEFLENTIQPIIAEVVTLLWKAGAKSDDLEAAFIRPEVPLHHNYDIFQYTLNENELVPYAGEKNTWEKLIDLGKKIFRR